jgi:anthranilate synthase component 2
MKLLVFDNYDSFTYNLVHLLREITDARIDVVRNDKIALSAIEDYDKIVISPGPGLPAESGLLLAMIRQYAATKPMLGVCLGHQALVEAFGGNLINLSEVHHGLSEPVYKIAEDPLFEGLPDSFLVGRYHSWIVNREAVPSCFEITSIDQDNQIMSVRHKQLPLHGVQFHPESVLTPDGRRILQNWLNV